MVFSTNQNRQFYVATSYNDSSAQNGKSIEDSTVAAGAIEAKVKDNELYFLSKNLKTSEVIKSDRINLKNLDYVKVVAAADMAKLLKSYKVTLDPAVSNDGESTPSATLVPGQDYLLRIEFRQFYAIGDENTYVKDVAVHATSDMTPTQFYAALVTALNKAFSREIGATATSNPYLTFSSSSAGLVITEKAQEYTVGIGARERVYFSVVPTTIFVDNAEQIWGKVEDISATTNSKITNGPDIAELEWFCMGERGDQYRMMGYPNYIPTQYCVDPSKVYNVVELHFAFTDTGVNSYRSEKDITIVCDASTNNTSTITLVKAIQTGASITAEKSATAATWTWT